MAGVFRRRHHRIPPRRIVHGVAGPVVVPAPGLRRRLHPSLVQAATARHRDHFRQVKLPALLGIRQPAAPIFSLARFVRDRHRKILRERIARAFEPVLPVEPPAAVGQAPFPQRPAIRRVARIAAASPRVAVVPGGGFIGAPITQPRLPRRDRRPRPRLVPTLVLNGVRAPGKVPSVRVKPLIQAPRVHRRVERLSVGGVAAPAAVGRTPSRLPARLLARVARAARQIPGLVLNGIRPPGKVPSRAAQRPPQAIRAQRGLSAAHSVGGPAAAQAGAAPGRPASRLLARVTRAIRLAPKLVLNGIRAPGQVPVRSGQRSRLVHRLLTIVPKLFVQGVAAAVAVSATLASMRPSQQRMPRPQKGVRRVVVGGSLARGSSPITRPIRHPVTVRIPVPALVSFVGGAAFIQPITPPIRVNKQGIQRVGRAIVGRAPVIITGVFVPQPVIPSIPVIPRKPIIFPPGPISLKQRPPVVLSIRAILTALVSGDLEIKTASGDLLIKPASDDLEIPSDGDDITL